MRMKHPLIAATLGVLSLAACQAPNPHAYPGQPNARAQNGAIAGALLGAGLGATLGHGDRLAQTALGGVVGAAAGTLIGRSLDRQAADLRNSLGNENIGVVNTGTELVVSMPQDILFDTDSTAVRPDLRAMLGKVADNLMNYPDSTVTVVGHTDNTGAAAYNQDLSQRRADAVANVLRDAGVRASRLIAYGRGESQPIATNLTAEGRAQNRRVEIHIQPNAN